MCIGRSPCLVVIDIINVQTATPAKTSNILHRIKGFGALLANPDEFLHGFYPLVPPAETTFTNGFRHEFGDGSVSTPGASVQGIPEVIVKVQLRSPHNVYCTWVRHFVPVR